METKQATPQKAKDKVWQIAEQNGLGYIVVGYGVDRIWDLIREEAEDELFLGLDEICINVLKSLNE